MDREQDLDGTDDLPIPTPNSPSAPISPESLVREFDDDVDEVALEAVVVSRPDEGTLKLSRRSSVVELGEDVPHARARPLTLAFILCSQYLELKSRFPRRRCNVGA